MNDKKAIAWLWIIIFYTILTFALSGVANPPAFLVRKYRLDWWLHGIEYGILAALMMKYFSYKYFINKEFHAGITTILFTGVVGGLNEALQAYVPHRYPSISDEIANLVGAVIFIGLYLVIRPVKTINNTINNL